MFSVTVCKEVNLRTFQISTMRIALVSDFFYPRLGGVEMHIFCLASCLVRMGHHVIIMTHAYDGESNSAGKNDIKNRCSKRTGVRYLEVDFPCKQSRASSPSSYIKVYHLPLTVMTDEDTLPTFLVSFPLIRWIWIRERIEVVHSHQATSTMANESVAYAAEMGLASVYTDHSLFGFDDLASVILNRVSNCIGKLHCRSLLFVAFIYITPP